jgi:hypothetical protein
LSFSVLQDDGETTPVRGIQPSVPIAQAPLLPRSTSNASSVRTSSTNQSLRKRPRISRSKVIAKLDQKRAAEDAVNAVRAPSLRFKGRTRSSVGVGLASNGDGLGPDAKLVASRRSFVTSGVTGSPRTSSGLARKERAALESFQHGQRKSEAAAARLKRTSRGLVPASRVIAEQAEDEWTRKPYLVLWHSTISGKAFCASRLWWERFHIARCLSDPAFFEYLAHLFPPTFNEQVPIDRTDHRQQFRIYDFAARSRKATKTPSTDYAWAFGERWTEGTVYHAYRPLTNGLHAYVELQLAREDK